MEDYEKKILEYIDTKNWEEFPIRELVYEYGIQTEYGEPRRWYRGASTISQVGDRFFLTQWDSGLTENQDSNFDEEPEEVFQKKETILVPEHYETKVYWETKNKEKFTMEGNK